MIALFLAFDRYLFPNHRRMDRVDHTLRWTIRVALMVLVLTLPDLYDVCAAQDDTDTNPRDAPGEDFFHACSGGDTALLQKSLEDHPEWVHAVTTNGETCLHLTGIYGKAAVTELLLEKGADPNVRSTYEKGLRMHPLSWNVYGGHRENIELLLKHGADINLDFDSMAADGASVTSLDVLEQLLENEEGDERFVAIREIFAQHGAKTMAQLRADQEQTTAGGGEEL